MTGRQGSAASKSAEAVVSADLEVRLLGANWVGAELAGADIGPESPQRAEAGVPRLLSLPTKRLSLPTKLLENTSIEVM